jgi:hypothetical protein
VYNSKAIALHYDEMCSAYLPKALLFYLPAFIDEEYAKGYKNNDDEKVEH